MKKLFISALMLTGVVAMAQEQPAKVQPAKQPVQKSEQAATTKKEATPATVVKAQPAAETKVAAPAKVATPAKEEKTEAKKADPAKKSK